MADGKKHQWMIYGAAAASLGYAMYKYLRYDRRSPEQLKEEGNNLYTNGNHEKALECYLEGLKAAEKNEDLEIQGALHNNISQAYFVLQEFPKALLHVEKTLKLRPTHLNSFKRLAKLEKMGCGHGGIRGIANIGAYIVLRTREAKDRSSGQSKEKEKENGNSSCKKESVEKQKHQDEDKNQDKKQDEDKNQDKDESLEWHKVLDNKIEVIAKKRAEQIKITDSLSISLVKLEEMLISFRYALSDTSFGTATEQDEETLRLIDQQEYAALLKHLEALRTETKKKSKRTLFIIGNIRYLQEKFELAIKYLTKSNNPYGAVLVAYIRGRMQMDSEDRLQQKQEQQKEKQEAEQKTEPILSPEQERLIKEKTNDPLIKFYLAQTYLFLDNIPEYLKCMIELENEAQISQAFISNAVSQLMYGEHEEALKTINKALKRFPDDVNTLCATVEILTDIEQRRAHHKNHLSDHRKQLEEILRTLENPKYKKSPRAWFFRYIGNSILNREEEATAAQDMTLEIDVYNTSLLIEKAGALIGSGNPIGFSMLEKAAMIQPETAESTYKKMIMYECIYEIQEIYPEISVATLQHLDVFAGILAGFS